MGERGVPMNQSTIYRWVQRYAPAVEKRLRCIGGVRIRRPGERTKLTWRFVINGRTCTELSTSIDTRSILLADPDSRVAKRFLGKPSNSMWIAPHLVNAT